MKCLLRLALLLILAATLPACGDEDDEDVRLSVTNNGTVDALIEIEKERWNAGEEEFEIAANAGQVATISVDGDNLSRLRVRIYRKTDLFKIFDEDYDRDDLDDRDFQIAITVSP